MTCDTPAVVTLRAKKDQPIVPIRVCTDVHRTDEPNPPNTIEIWGFVVIGNAQGAKFDMNFATI